MWRTVTLVCNVAVLLAAGALRSGVSGATWKVLGAGDLDAAKFTRVASAFSNTVLYTFGGEWDGVYSNELRSFDLGKKKWGKLEATGGMPGRRAGATLTKLSSALYLIGGHNEHGTLGSIHRYDVITNKWQKVRVSGDVDFTPRSGHAACTDGRNRIFVFGGYNDDGLFLNDLYEIRISSKTNPESSARQFNASVKLLNEDRSPGALNPSPKESASMEVVEDMLYLFGGYTYGGSSSDGMWVFDLKNAQWRAVESEVLPPPSEGMSSVTLGRSIFFFGGCDFGYSSNRCFSDLWRFDTAASKWYYIPTAGNRPVGRAFAAMAFINDAIIVHGGSKRDKRAFGETYMLHDLLPCKDPAHTCIGRGTCSGVACSCSKGYEGHDCGVVAVPEDDERTAEVPFYTEM